MSVQKPKITVAIPTLGRDQVLVDTIRDVLKQDFDGFELVVVDQTIRHDGPTQKFLDNLKDPRFRYFLVGPPSLPAARNYAMEQAATEIVLFIDDDVILSPDFIKHHYDAYQLDPEIVAVAGRVINQTDTQKQTTVPLSFDRYAMGRSTFNCIVSQYATSFPGGNVSVRRDRVLAIGGFDPSYKWSAIREKSDVAFRLVQSGYKIYYEAQASLIHLAAPSGGARLPTHYFDNLNFYRNDLLFAVKSVKLMDLPIALAKRYRDALRQTRFVTKAHRSWLFLAGLVVAWRFRIWPDRLVQQPISQTES